MDEEIKRLAAAMSLHFTWATRDNGEVPYKGYVGTFVFVKRSDDAPPWLEELCHDAHGTLLPDDWRYSFIVEALDAIAHSDDPDEAESEVDVYTHELLSWLASNLDRVGYCDEAAEEGLVSRPPAASRRGPWRGPSLIERISMGQLMERREVTASVLDSLRSHLEDSDGPRCHGSPSEPHTIVDGTGFPSDNAVIAARLEDSDDDGGDDE